jgi:long-chain acyl-CoA synthetase
MNLQLKTEHVLADPKSTFTVTFFKTPGGKLQAARLTHENMTAGVAATRVLLPLSNAISPLDTIVSAHSLSTAYGRAVAYTALYEGCSFATTDSSKLIHGCECHRPGMIAYDLPWFHSLSHL